jgi:5'-nucleotidase
VAAQFALRIARYIIKKELPQNTFLNINVPNLDEKEIKSYKITQQGRLVHGGNGVIEKMDPRGRKYYWIGGGQLIFNKERNTDVEAVSKSYISITPLTLDLTNYSSIREIKKWKL